MRTGAPTEDVGRRMGLARARQASQKGAVADPIGVIEHEMARAGFRPVRREGPRPFELVLENRPFEGAAAVNAKDVCRLHLGLTKGLAEGIGGVVVEDLVARNPHKAGCRLLVKAL